MPCEVVVLVGNYYSCTDESWFRRELLLVLWWEVVPMGNYYS